MASFYAICNRQVIANDNDYDKLVEVVKTIYKDMVEKQGVIIVDNKSNKVSELGPSIKLITLNSPEKAIFSVTSTDMVVLEDASFVPPLPTITNWENVLWTNYLSSVDENANCLEFLAKTDVPFDGNVFCILQFQPDMQSIVKPIGGDWIQKTISIDDINIRQLARMEFNVPENTKWWFSQFKMIKK